MNRVVQPVKTPSFHAERGLRVVRSAAGLGAIEPQWRELEANAGIFQTWSWNASIAEHYADTSGLFVALLEHAGEPVALAPLACRQYGGLRTLAFLSSGLQTYSMADYGDILVRTGWKDSAMDALAHRLQDEVWDCIWLQEVPPTSPLLHRWPSAARRRGWRALAHPAADTYAVELPETWEAYTDGLGTRTRKRLGNHTRRLEREKGAVLRLVEDPTELDGAMDALFDLHTRRWSQAGAPGIFATGQDRAFYRDVSHRLLQEGRLRLTLLESEDGHIGAGYSFACNGTCYGYTVGYLREPAYETYSLGLLLDTYDVKQAIAHGDRRVDFMRGHGDYKRHYNVVSSQNTDILVFRNRAVELRFRAYRKARATARRLLRRTG